LDLKQFISSGVLEQYVLGLLSEKEAGEVMNMMQLHPEVSDYVHKLQTSLDTYSRFYEVRPPDGLKDQVMAGIRKEIENRADQGQKGQPVPIQPPLAKYSRLRKLAVAAAFILLCSIGLNIYLSNQIQVARAKVGTLSTQSEQLKAENQRIHNQLDQKGKALTLLYNPDIRRVTMNGVKQHTDAKATIYWSANKQTAFLANADLPATPAGKVYQLWAIVDGKPVDLGLFTPKDQVNLPIELKKIQPGSVQAFAITLENQGGSPTPTMDQMYVMGSASS